MARILGTYVTNLKGRVGNVVYRYRDGKNIASERPATVKNPRTDSQQKQRMTLRTISAAYSTFKELCDHSFEGVTYGSKSMAKFMKLNLDMLHGANKNFNFKHNPTAAPNPLIIAQGSLPQIITSDGEFEYGSDELKYSAIKNDNLSQKFVDYTLDKITPDYILKALELQAGDQLTFVTLSTQEGATKYTYKDYEQRSSSLSYARIVFTDDIVKLRTEPAFFKNDDTGLYEINEEVIKSSDSLNWLNIVFAVKQKTIGDSLYIYLCFADKRAAYAEAGVLGTAIIASRKDGDTWKRSNTILCDDTNTTDYATGYALPTYDPSNAKYLNHAVS